MGMSFPVLQYTAVPQCSGSPEKSFLEGKVLLQRAAAQAEQLSVDVMMPLLFYDGKEDGRGWMENLLAAVRDQIPALREGSTAENTLSAGTEAAETDTAKQDSNPGPGAERGQTESKEQGTEEDQKDGTQKDETQKDGMEITEPEQTETGITEPAAGESASTAERSAAVCPGGDHRNRRRTA